MKNAAAKIVSLHTHAIAEPLAENDPIASGKTGVFMARSQIPIVAKELMIEDGGRCIEARIHDQVLAGIPGSVLEIEDPLFVEIENTGKGPLTFFPMLLGESRDKGDPRKGFLFVPFVRVREPSSDSMQVLCEAESSVVLTKIFPRVFQPRKIIAKSDSLASFVLQDIQVGLNSQSASSGEVSLAFFEERRSPALVLDKVPRGLPFSVSVKNTDKKAHHVAIKVEGEPF